MNFNTLDNRLQKLHKQLMPLLYDQLNAYTNEAKLYIESREEMLEIHNYYKLIFPQEGKPIKGSWRPNEKTVAVFKKLQHPELEKLAPPMVSPKIMLKKLKNILEVQNTPKNDNKDSN